MKYASVREWVEAKQKKYTLNKKDAEKFDINSYLNALQKFLTFTQLSPPKLLEESIDKSNNRVMDFVNYYVNKLNRNEVSVKNGYVSRILSFYSYNSHKLTVKIETEKQGKNEHILEFDKEMLKQIYLKLESIEYKVIFLLQCASGLRIEDILSEIPQYEVKEVNGHLYIENFKTKKENVIIHYVFFTKELCDLLKSAPIYRNYRITLHTRNDTKVNQINYRQRLYEICEELSYIHKIPYPNHPERLKYDLSVKTHYIRKLFMVAIENHMDTTISEHFLGHKKKEDQYRDPMLKNFQKMFQAWLPCEPDLSLFYETVDATASKTLALEKIVHTQQARIDRLQEWNRAVEKYDRERHLKSKERLESRMRRLEKIVFHYDHQTVEPPADEAPDPDTLQQLERITQWEDAADKYVTKETQRQCKKQAKTR